LDSPAGTIAADVVSANDTKEGGAYNEEAVVHHLRLDSADSTLARHAAGTIELLWKWGRCKLDRQLVWIMFLRKLRIERMDEAGMAHACPIAQLDNFAMRNFTNDAIFDDTLPVGDGLLEVGNRIPLDRLTTALEDWFRRKSYLAPTEHIRITELAGRTNGDLSMGYEGPQSRL
jgi:hypothetical protein